MRQMPKITWLAPATSAVMADYQHSLLHILHSIRVVLLIDAEDFPYQLEDFRLVPLPNLHAVLHGGHYPLLLVLGTML